MSAPTATNGEQSEVQIVTEVPPSLHKALLLLVKNFFSGEHFLIVYYIMRAVCIREENLRNKLMYDQKQLRQQLASLRAEKLVKDRNVSQKNEAGRTQSTIFYFINYRAIINVLKYKIDHMRQKLEAKEKEDVQKAHYKCEQCGALYETLEVDRILNPMTGLLQCWRCHGNVAPDETSGPTQVTRSLLAKFNEQMLPLFAVIRELAGIQLAPHLLEPDIAKYMAEEEKQAAPQLFNTLDFSHEGKVALGAKAFSGHRSAPTLKYAHGDQIIVDLNADSSAKVVEETKAVPLWLQDDAIVGSGEHAAAAESLSNDTTEEEEVKTGKSTSSSSVTLDMLRELETAEEPEAKRPRMESDRLQENGAGEDLEKTQESGEEEEDEEEEEMVTFQGNKIPLSEVTEEMVSQMTEDEKEEYSRVVSAMYEM